MRVGFQGEAGAFSEAAAMQLLGAEIETVPCTTFDAAFRAIRDGKAEALLLPVENSLAGSVVRVYDLLLESELQITAETILPIEHHLIGCPGASLADIRAVASHPMALAQCEKFFAAHPALKRTPAEDTAGSVRQMMARGDKALAALAGKRAAERYGAVILASDIQDDRENFTRFVLLKTAQEPTATAPHHARRTKSLTANGRPRKMSLAMRLAHRPGALLESLQPFARHGGNLLKIESRPIHGRPWEYQFFVDVEAAEEHLEDALTELRASAHEVRVLGVYEAAKESSTSRAASGPGRKPS